jgi:hypothetical protein
LNEALSKEAAPFRVLAEWRASEFDLLFSREVADTFDRRIRMYIAWTNSKQPNADTSLPQAYDYSLENLLDHASEPGRTCLPSTHVDRNPLSTGIFRHQQASTKTLPHGRGSIQDHPGDRHAARTDDPRR